MKRTFLAFTAEIQWLRSGQLAADRFQIALGLHDRSARRQALQAPGQVVRQSDPLLLRPGQDVEKRGIGNRELAE